MSDKIPAKPKPPVSYIQPKKSVEKRPPPPVSSTTADILVYVPNLPVDLSAEEIENTIKSRLKAAQRIEPIDVKCFSTLGIAIIHLMNEQDKQNLISEVQSIVLDKERDIIVSFVDEIERDSYIVIKTSTSKLLSSDDVASRFAKTYKTQKNYTCQPVSSQFPNIFCIQSLTLEDLINVADAPDFKINGCLATIYPRADCSFFEDLPLNLTDEKISCAIAAQIGEKEFSATSFYVQYNRSAAIAAVVVVRSIKKWVKAGSLTIDGQKISKKAKLAYRVIVSPVPREFDLNRILKHKLFVSKVISHKLIDDKLVVELNSIDAYQNCLDMGAVGIDGKLMNIKPHSAVIDPDDSELDAANWYETAMLDIKPDITTIMDNLQHPIFRYKWNADNWNEQMKKAKQDDRQRSNKYDLNRHLLRVTVMLNTIRVLRKGKYVVDDEEVTLKLQKLQTIGYDHRSKLFSGKTVRETEWKTPFKSTRVKVVNVDCLVLYEKLVAEGYKPLLLNMANATSPGGGFRKGDGAQEENIFRRSDYYHSLDLEIADKKRSNCSYCASNGKITQLTGFRGLYPMEEFGAIYTSGITVFRETEDNGYEYMKNPLYNVCAIAMAAYRQPMLTSSGMLEKKPAMNTHKKIENIFAIGHHQKHDRLVLSALGCGAFRNPPKHIALLFKSVIQQYAGYFDTIYFAIVNDHNAGKQLNPNGNVYPFQKLLDGLTVEPPSRLQVNGVSGPYRVLSKTAEGEMTLSDTYLMTSPPCQHGAKCTDRNNSQHTASFSHPPMCSLSELSSTCEQLKTDDVHMCTFIHNLKCKQWGECKNTKSTHLNDYDHPDYCQNKFSCNDNNPEHLFQYRHLPICEFGHKCRQMLSNDAEHMQSVRHCQPVCPHDNCCPYFHENSHVTETFHTFRPPCPFTPYQCRTYIQYCQITDKNSISNEIKTHCLQFSHVCPFGRRCKNDDDLHRETTIHIARQLCPDGNQCQILSQEDHLESFSHPDIQDIRSLCLHPGFKCHDRSSVHHLRKFRHGKNYDHLTVAPSSNLNASINFVRNQAQIIRAVNSYIGAENWKKAKISREILDWIRALQPVHRCKHFIFESILVHGHVMSLNYMKLLEKPKNVAKAVLQHSRVRLIFLQHNIPTVKENAYRLIEALVESKYAETVIGGKALAKLDPDHEQNVNLIRKKLQPTLSDNDLTVICDWTSKITEASIKILNNPTGLKYPPDEKLGTDKHVFSILGPHRGYYYGDVVIVFKQDILFHPDTNFSIRAGTRFLSEKIYPKRPWTNNPGNEVGHIKDFHSAKLHCSVPRYENAAATELIASTGLRNKSMNITLEDIIKYWVGAESHDVFECHLPQLIPLDYIDRVYIPQNMFDALSHSAQQSAKGAFKDSLIITPHDLDLSLVKPVGLIDLDSTRQPYLDYILAEINEKIKENMKTPCSSRGIAITVPGSRFEEHTVLPLSISQSYELYRLDHPKAPNHPESTYIYWKAMHGDMMITISNETINPKEKQDNLRYLVCYVAEKPSTNNEDYHETYSYINDASPLQHYVNIHHAKFRAKSNLFYRGCNTDDFLTFCLKLCYTNNEVKLSHAGPNGIYNHQKINYKFDKSTLDLSRIDYIHVSGGNQDVPIRNLTIHHEKVAEFHPTFDQDFKIDTSKLIVKKQLVPVPYYGGEGPIDRPSRSEEPPESKPQERRKRSLVKRMKIFFYGSSKPKRSQSVPNNESFILKKSDSNPPPSPPTKRRHSNVSVSSLPSSDLPPCHDSVYCLQQNSKSHMERYSHPCRYNELCNRAADEPHLTHKRHDVPNCSAGRDCNKLTDPVHRAKYRHRNLPDYLLPCRFQQDCRDKKNAQHCQRYFHGEELPMFSRLTSF